MKYVPLHTGTLAKGHHLRDNLIGLDPPTNQNFCCIRHGSAKMADELPEDFDVIVLGTGNVFI